MDEIRIALEAAESSGCFAALLHCVANYPSQAKDLNLRTIPWMASKFERPTGFSDHTEGIWASIAAASVGACIVEKHFTLNKNMEGPDHKLSIDPDEMEMMVGSLRNVEKALGQEEKKPVESEEQIVALRRSLAAVAKIDKGASITRDLISIIRPGTGIPPGDLEKVLGQKARVDIGEGKLLSWEDFE